jgi:rhodanese-related sulfurtransferase
MMRFGEILVRVSTIVVLVLMSLLCGCVSTDSTTEVLDLSATQNPDISSTEDPCVLDYEYENGVVTLVDECNQLGPRQGEVTADQAYQLQENGALILDVRSREEWSEVRIPGAKLIPLDELPGRLNEIPLDIPVILQCRSGNRSQQGLGFLMNVGFSNIISMRGGIQDWMAAGFSIEK